MYVEPDGESYEMQLVGEVGENKEPLVFSNKQYLTWGGVQVGHAL